MGDLTDEQIDYFTGIIRESAADDRVIMPRAELVDHWLAAVIARARREAMDAIIERLRDEVETMTVRQSHVLGFVDGIRHSLGEVRRLARRAATDD